MFIKDQTIEEIAATFPYLAKDLAIRGVRAVRTLTSPKAVAQLYLCGNERFVFVTGSRALYKRYMAILSEYK